MTLEAMAQATGLLAFKTFGEAKDNEIYLLASIDKAKFKGQGVPGDQLDIKVEYIKNRRGIAGFNGYAYVNDLLVCSAELKCARRDF